MYKSWGITQLGRNHLREIMRLRIGHCHFKGHLFKVGLVTVLGVINANRPLKWPHMFLVTVRHLGHHFLKPDDFANISISKVLNSVEVWGC
jgi:hypothetical protein